MESNWRSNNYYDSQESYGNTNQNNNPFQFNNFSKTLILILIIILIIKMYIKLYRKILHLLNNKN